MPGEKTETQRLVLVVEDEKSIADILRFNLELKNYRVSTAYDGEEGLAKARAEKPDLILLDIMLPKMIGFEVCEILRKEGNNVPIILLTAREEEDDKVKGLEIGADDYITKPFAIEELLARIRAALRKHPAQAVAEERQLLRAKGLSMDPERHEVTVDGQHVELTRREFDLLRYLLENKEKVISRESLLDNVWGFDFVGETNAVDVYIRFLRSKIDERFGMKLIHTVRGVGYVIREA